MRVVIAGGHGKIALLHLRTRDLDWTILRPGGLTDAPATGRIRLAPPPVPAGTIPRADVAAVIAALLDHPGARHQTLELVAGDSPVATAVTAFLKPARQPRASGADAGGEPFTVPAPDHLVLGSVHDQDRNADRFWPEPPRLGGDIAGRKGI